MTQNDGSFLYMPNMKSDQKNFRDLSEQPDSIDSTIHIWRVHRLRCCCAGDAGVSLRSASRSERRRRREPRDGDPRNWETRLEYKINRNNDDDDNNNNNSNDVLIMYSMLMYILVF